MTRNEILTALQQLQEFFREYNHMLDRMEKNTESTKVAELKRAA